MAVTAALSYIVFDQQAKERLRNNISPQIVLIGNLDLNFRKEKYSIKLFIRFLYDAKMRNSNGDKSATAYVKFAGTTIQAC